MRLVATELYRLNQSSVDCFSIEGFGFGSMLAVIVGGAKDRIGTAGAGAASAAASSSNIVIYTYLM